MEQINRARQLYIPSVKLLRVALNSDEEKFFEEKFQQQNLNYCLERQFQDL
jgi:hypothetical protein